MEGGRLDPGRKRRTLGRWKERVEERPDLVSAVEEGAGRRRSGHRRLQFAPQRHGRESPMRTLGD